MQPNQLKMKTRTKKNLTKKIGLTVVLLIGVYFY